MTNSPILFLATLLATFLALSTPLLAGEETVTFAFFPRGWPPFEMTKDGEMRGAALDIFQAIMPREMKKDIEPIPKPRTLLHSPSDKVYTRMEAKGWMPEGFDYWWSAPVLKISDVLYSRADAPFEYHGPESLAGKTIGCVRNYTYPKVEALFTTGKAHRYDVNHDILLLRMVKAGRVDAAILDDITAKWMIRNSEDFSPEDFHVAAMPVDSSELRFVFNRVAGWDRWLPSINARIRALRDNGGLRRILNKYADSPIPRTR
ncbi:substrate-binding periplasmic protein [Pseudodesulfovibrio cashew]|nr:ABC transporter substrate-binding protein [Pseudodesulfovibrio cashew]